MANVSELRTAPSPWQVYASENDDARRESSHITLQPRPVCPSCPSRYFRWKPIASRACALVLLIPATPILLLLIALVRTTSKGPGIYSQQRVGKDGRLYTMYKIRTMRIDAEDKSGPVWSAGEADPRVTRIGRILRDRHLDEFPQLINVIRGEMDLFGPRPERPEFTEILCKEIPEYAQRLQVLPGITGLAQINLPPDNDIDDVRRKLILDFEYIQRGSILLDARMFLATFFRLLGIPGDAVMRWMRLDRCCDGTDLTSLEIAQPDFPARTS